MVTRFDVLTSARQPQPRTQCSSGRSPRSVDPNSIRLIINGKMWDQPVRKGTPSEMAGFLHKCGQLGVGIALKTDRGPAAYGDASRYR